MIEARHKFEEVIRLVPDSPVGYSDVAWTHYFDVERGWSPDPGASLESMEELARKALELGDDSGFSQLMLGHMYLMRRQHDEALRWSDDALRERPSCQAAYGLKANILNYSGLPQDAVPLARQAIRLSPVAQTFFPEVLATSYYLAGCLEEAIAAAQHTLELAPDSLDARLILVASLVETGRLVAAREAAREIPDLEPSFSLRCFSASQPLPRSSRTGSPARLRPKGRTRGRRRARAARQRHPLGAAVRTLETAGSAASAPLAAEPHPVLAS